MEQIHPFTSGQIQYTFKILGLNFVTWPGQGNQGTLFSATFLASNNSLEDLPMRDLFCHENNQFITHPLATPMARVPWSTILSYC